MQSNKLSLRQNGNKRICLYSNAKGTTPVVIEDYASLHGSRDFIVNNFHSINKKNLNYYTGSDKDSTYNDLQLKNLLVSFEEIASHNPELVTPKQILYTYLGKEIKVSKEDSVTLDSFLAERIAYIQYTEESNNYKNYITARNCIAKVSPKLANKRLKDITSGDIAIFQEVLIAKAPTSFYKTMRTLQATINDAKKKNYCKGDFNWDWKKIRTNKEEEAHQYIKSDMLNMIFNIDIDSVRGKMPYLKCKMYLDIIKLLYYTASRPIDTMQFNMNNIEGNRWIYTPAKKTIKSNNGHEPTKAKTPINDEAMAIINKYKENASSLNGYIFPITSNKNVYPNPIKRGNIRNKIQREINVFLKRIGEQVGIEKLTMYDFRKTRITNLVEENKIPIPGIALMAGTSEKMIHKHYISKDDILNSFAKYF